MWLKTMVQQQGVKLAKELSSHHSRDTAEIN
jgi:hypothetical protein